MKKEISVAIAAIIVMLVFVGIVSAGVGELYVTPTSWSPTIDAGDSKTKEFTIKNRAGVYEDYAALEGLTVSITSGPEWLEISQSNVERSLPAWSKTYTAYKFLLRAAPPETVDGSFSYKVRVSCTKGFPSYIDITGEITVPPPPVGELYVTPTSWSPNIGAGDSKTKEFTIKNRAGVYEDYAALEGLAVSITSGPEWLEISQSNVESSLSAWSKTYTAYNFILKAAPPENVKGTSSYKVRVSCTKGFPSYIDIAGKITVTPKVTTPTTPTPTKPAWTPSAPAKAPLLTISQTILKEEPKVGEETLVKVSLLNRGGVEAKNILLSESIPSSVSVSHVSGAYSTGNIVTWSGELEKGKTHSIQHTFKMLEVKDRAVPVTVTYEDSDGNEYEASSTIYIATKKDVPAENIDSDGDGVPDEYDYAPHDPKVQTKDDVKAPGFEAVVAIAGLMAVAYLLRRRG